MSRSARSIPTVLFLDTKQIHIAQRRSFSSTGCQNAVVTSHMRSIKIRPEKAIKVTAQEEMKKGLIGDSGGFSMDMGLLPDTFVMPAGHERPSWYRMPRERLKLEWHRLLMKFKDLTLIWAYRAAAKSRPKIQFWNKAAAAKTLHNQMYSALAGGDTETLNAICVRGLADDFSGRISRRDPKHRLKWMLHKHIGAPRVVSHRAAALPNVEGAGVRQAVVRIRSVQSLETLGNISSDDNPTNFQDKTEYIVLQKSMWNNVEGPWRVWGTTTPSDWKVIL